MTDPLRVAVMGALDDFVERADGTSPDHLFVSRAIWEHMRETQKFERLQNPDSPPRRPMQTGLPYDHRYGFFGMRVWPCSYLDEDDTDMILISEELFAEMYDCVMPTVQDQIDQP